MFGTSIQNAYIACATRLLPLHGYRLPMSSLMKSVVGWKSQFKVPQQDGNLQGSDLCETCGLKPKYVENGFQHPFCSKSCSKAQTSPVADPHARPGTTPCKAQGCNAPGRQRFGGFCSENHSRQLRHAAQDKSALIELPPQGATFKSIVSHMSTEWGWQDQDLTVKKIYEVVLPDDARKQHDAYRYTPGSKQKLDLRTYYSSQCMCNLGVNGPALCSFQSCGICTVVKSVFSSFAFGEPSNVGRYGEGIYSYLDPSIADRHATSCTSSPYRVMIACDVFLASDPTKKQSDTDINDGERVFVKDSRAIIPAYVIAYTK